MPERTVSLALRSRQDVRASAFEPWGPGDVFRSGLREIVALRAALDGLETALVVGARRRGYTWRELGEDLGLSAHGARKRHLADRSHLRLAVAAPPPGAELGGTRERTQDVIAAGRLDEHVITSEALRGNPLNDPHERPLWVYTPPGYAGGPIVYVLQGFTGQIEMWRNRVAFRPTFLELLDREDVDARVVFVDAFTSVGGSQFVDSNGSGRYHTYICDEIVPFVDALYDSNGFRGVAGKSSGGYGAAVTAMLRPDLFSGFASHAGGGLFEVSIRPFFRLAARRLRDAYDGSIERFLDELRTGPAPLAHPDDLHVLLQWGFSAAYSADEDGTIRLPYDVTTAQVIPERWERWLESDFPTLVPRHAEGLRGMRAIYIDVGTRDEWYLDLTAEWLRRELTALRVPDLHVELFDATHLAIEYRYPIGLRYLADRLR